MWPADTSQMGPSPEDTDMDDAPTSQLSSALPAAFNIGQGLAYRPKNNQNQQSGQHGSGDNHQAHIGAIAQQDAPPAQAQARDLTQDPPPWPAGAFSDDDPATARMIAIMQSLELRAPSPTAAKDIVDLPSGNETREKQNQPFEQLWRHRRRPGDANFFLQFPDRPESMMGKVRFSEAGLAVIIEALRTVVRGYEGTVSVTPLARQIDQLNAARNTLRFTAPAPTIWNWNYGCDIDPFTLVGARMAVAVTQAASLKSESQYVLFYAYGCADATSRRSMIARLEVQPIDGWTD